MIEETDTRAPDGPPPLPAPSPAAALPAAAPAYLAPLYAAQRAAVEAADGPVLVLAGAGTGKTRVLTTRLAHILVSRRLSPFRLLAVTFTNKAAREMRDRVAALVGAPIEGWWLGTFHSLAARMLRRHAELVGLTPSFTILDTDDQLRLLKGLIGDAGIDAKKWPARQLLGVIERWKDRGLTPDKLKPEDGGQVAGGRVIALYQAYQARLVALNACDFGDLLLHTLAVFQSHPDILTDYHRRFQYLLVDEYQDTNVAQYLWLRLLAQGRRNICCVGDEDQSIYGWRGAEIGNILRFEQDFPGATVVRLEENYRSTRHILGAASGLIAHNKGRLGKTLYTSRDGGELVEVYGHLDSDDEARWIGDQIEARQRAGDRLGEIAVLVRAGFQTREIEERLLQIGVPYRVLGGPRFYERLEIRDALAYLRLINEPRDDLAFERIVNTPKRGLGPAAVQAITRLARAQELPLTEAAWRLTETDELKTRPRSALRGLLQDLERWRALERQIAHTELARQVLDESGYTRMWQTDKSPEAPGRLENLKELINALAEFVNLAGFLEHVALVMEAAEAEGGDQVNLMTLHGAKGLEFDTVFLPGWEEGLFPNQRAVDETGIAGLEEERRLAYVGLTRARLRARISFAARRRAFGKWADALPSRFLDELPAEHARVKPAIDVEVGGAVGGAVGGFAEASVPFTPAPRRPFTPPPGARRSPPPPGRGVTLDGTAYEVAPRPRPAEPYRPGARVFHRKFGYGTVEAVEDEKLEISFDHAGTKRVMDGFVVPADQAD